MQVLMGAAASDGRAIGPAVFLRRNRTSVGRSVGAPAHEVLRFEKAKISACEELLALEDKAPEQDKTIFTVQRIMLDDDGLCHEINAYIQAGAGAAASVERAANLYAQRLRAIGDNYMSERACDVLDACQRIVNILDGGASGMPNLTKPSIIVSDEIYPTDIMSQPSKNVLGFVTVKGSPNAHASIIARSMGIPAVVQTNMSFDKDCDSLYIALDGSTGEVFIDPDDETVARFEQLERQQRRRDRELEMLRMAPCITKDGTTIRIYASCVTPKDIKAAVKLGCAGISVLLSDYLFEARHFDTEETQYKFYTDCLKAADGLPVTITTYDIGTHSKDDNTPVGAKLRGVRYGFEHPTFFRTELTALLRASAKGELRIAFPFVTSAEELDAALAFVDEAKNILRARGEPFNEKTLIGVCIDTPAAALCASELAKKSDFLAFTIRRLTQYSYAVNITDKTELKYCPLNTLAPAARKLIEYAMLAADAAGVPYGVSGEWASHGTVAEDCAKIGLRHITVPFAAIPQAKETLAGLDLSK